MAISLKLHEDDEREMFRIRRELVGWHHATGTTQHKMAETLGRSDKFFHELETGHTHYRFSSLQDWASLFDLRVEPLIVTPMRGVPAMPERLIPELKMLDAMSRPFDAGRWIRLYTVARLAAHRQRLEVSVEEMASRLGIKKSAVQGWERTSHDPLMPKLLTYARALDPAFGTSFIRFCLVERRDYVE